MVGALTQSYIKNGGSEIRLHKTLRLDEWTLLDQSSAFLMWEIGMSHS